MRAEPRRLLTSVLFVLLTSVVRAQEAEPPKPPPEETPKPAAVEDESNEVPLEKLPEAETVPSRKLGRFYMEGGVWFAQPTGLEYNPAITYADPSDGRVLDLRFNSETPPRWRFGWQMPNDRGEFIGTYFAYTQQQSITQTAPGQYVYGELEAFPLFAGAFDDGLADAFTAHAKTDFREIRIDYARDLFQGPHSYGKWFVGARRDIQKWDLAAEYFSIVQPPELFPPVVTVPPRTDLVPISDTVHNLSEYEGRGLEAGMDMKFPFDHAGKFSFEGGFAVAALRGKLHTDSSAQNGYYVLSFEGTETVLAAPFDIFNEMLQPADPDADPVPAINHVSQRTVGYRLQGSNLSHSAFALEVYLGFRWKIWKDLEVFGGYRDQRLDDAGEIVRPTASVTPAGAVNIQSVSHTPIGTTYEGYYLGVGYLF